MYFVEVFKKIYVHVNYIVPEVRWGGRCPSQ